MRLAVVKNSINYILKYNSAEKNMLKTDKIQENQEVQNESMTVKKKKKNRKSK